MKERIERKLDGYINAILEKETLTAEDFGLLVSYYSWTSLRDMKTSMDMCCCDIFGGKKDGLQ